MPEASTCNTACFSSSPIKGFAMGIIFGKGRKMVYKGWGRVILRNLVVKDSDYWLEHFVQFSPGF